MFVVVNKFKKFFGKKIYNIFSVFFKNKYVKLDVAESYNKLNRVSPAPNTSCYLEASGEKRDPVSKYDLDIIIPVSYTHLDH